MIYDLTKRAGRRVRSVQVRCYECLVPSYSALNEDQIYPVLLSNFLIEGGDGYSMFTEEKLSQERFSKLNLGAFCGHVSNRFPVGTRQSVFRNTEMPLLEYILGKSRWSSALGIHHGAST